MGFALLVIAFFGLAAVCFLPALSELRRPRDPGPLPIDPKRDISERHFARDIRARGAAGAGPLVFDGDLRVAPGSAHDCEILVAGDAIVGAGASLEAIVAEGFLVLEDGVSVARHAEGAYGLRLASGAEVRGRATSPVLIEVEPGSAFAHAAAPYVCVAGAAQVAAPAAFSMWSEALGGELERLLATGASLDAALRRLRPSREVSGLDALSHLQRRGAIGAMPAALAGPLAVGWLGSLRGWYLGAGTARVRGDLVLPQGSIVPFNLIVEGSLAAGPAVRFHGSVSCGGEAFVGDGSIVRGSLTVHGDVRLGAGTWIGECVAASGDVSVGAGCSVGGDRSGGLAAEGRVRLEQGVSVRNKVYAAGGARVALAEPARR